MHAATGNMTPQQHTEQPNTLTEHGGVTSSVVSHREGIVTADLRAESLEGEDERDHPLNVGEGEGRAALEQHLQQPTHTHQAVPAGRGRGNIL